MLNWQEMKVLGVIKMKRITEIKFFSIFSTKRIRRFAQSAGLMINGVKLNPREFFFYLLLDCVAQLSHH